MPVTCRERNGKWYVVEADTGRRARNAEGAPVHKEPYDSRQECVKQARAINASLGREGKI